MVDASSSQVYAALLQSYRHEEAITFALRCLLWGCMLSGIWERAKCTRDISMHVNQTKHPCVCLPVTLGEPNLGESVPEGVNPLTLLVYWTMECNSLN